MASIVAVGSNHMKKANLLRAFPNLAFLLTREQLNKAYDMIKCTLYIVHCTLYKKDSVAQKVFDGILRALINIGINRFF